MDNYMEIREVLGKFQAGYTERNVDKVDDFIEELFVKGENTYVLGTSTSELCLGTEKVKELVRGDWEGWGDVKIDLEKAQIGIEGNGAWFATAGSVRYTFEYSPEKYDRHVGFIKEMVEEPKLTPRQKISFINWALSLMYHQRTQGRREYFWPMRLSGTLIKNDGKWKFMHLQFSMAKANFPDERFENSKEHLEDYNKQKVTFKLYKNNQIDIETRGFLKTLETELIGPQNISKETVCKYFAADKLPYIIAPENKWYSGCEMVRDFLESYAGSKLSLDLEDAIASNIDGVVWVTATGTLQRELTEDSLAEAALEEIDKLFNSNITSEEKLFNAHRSVSYVLKESASGIKHTCPIRLTAVILKGNDGLVFHNIHFSYPFYWILEGKLDNVLM